MVSSVGNRRLLQHLKTVIHSSLLHAMLAAPPAHECPQSRSSSSGGVQGVSTAPESERAVVRFNGGVNGVADDPYVDRNSVAVVALVALVTLVVERGRAGGLDGCEGCLDGAPDVPEAVDGFAIAGGAREHLMQMRERHAREL
jgi:hypothetical protein